MNVLVVSSKYPPEYSGSGNRAHSTYLRLTEKFDIKSETICSSVEFTESAVYQPDGIQVQRIVSPLLRRIDQRLGKGQFRRFTNAVVYHAEARTVTRSLARKNFDLIHVFGYSPATIAAINWSRRNAIPLILEIVNNVISPYQYLPGTRKFRTLDLSHQSVVVAISKHISKLCESEGLIHNVWTRPNPVDTRRFKPVHQDRRADVISTTFGFNPADKIIVYVSKFMKQKNHEFLVDVLKHLPTEFKLVLAGPTVTSGELDPGMRADQLPQLQSRIDAADLGNRVKVIPTFVDIAEYLAGADVFCFPAQNEAMGTPLIEALSSGTPVIANVSEPSFAEWIVDGENGYLAPLNAPEWANAVQAAADFDEQKRLQINRSVNDIVSADIIDAKYQKLLQALISTNRNEKVNVAEVLAN